MFAVNVAVVSFVFVPFFYLIYLGQQEYKKINKLFKEEASRLGLNIEVKDRWNQNALGIDTRQGRLLFVQKRHENFFVENIDLCSVVNCEISHQVENLKINGINEQVLQKISLDLIHFNGNIVASVCLFDYEYTLEQDFEMKHAEQWKKFINSNLAPHLKKPLAA